MKRFIKLTMLLITIFFIFPINIYAKLDIKSKEVVLINLNEDEILLEKNADTKTYIASLTKIMSAVVALENINNLNSKVSITYQDIKDLPYDTSLSGLSLNKSYTYLDLLYGLMLPSGADCANALARNIAKSNSNFIKMMNEKAKELDMVNTHFSNTHGLDDVNNYSTARDLSKLMKYAIKNEVFMKIISTMHYKNMNHTIYYYTNKYNLSLPYLIGGKTGSDTKAGYNLASIAEDNGVRYLLVSLNATTDSPNHFLDAKEIYEYYINNYGYHKVIKKGDILKEFKTKYLKEDKIVIKADKDYEYYLNNNYKNNINITYNGIDVISPSNQKGQYLGLVTIKYGDEVLDSVSLILDSDIKFSLIKFIKYNKDIVYPICGIILFVWCLVVLKKKK